MEAWTAAVLPALDELLLLDQNLGDRQGEDEFDHGNDPASLFSGARQASKAALFLFQLANIEKESRVHILI